VAIPMFLSVATFELMVMGWMFFLLTSEDRNIWIALQLGVYIALYQTVLLTLPSLKAHRLLIIGLIGFCMIMLRIFHFLRRMPDMTFTLLLIGVAVAAFFVSWMSVALQRSDARLIRHSVLHRIVSRIALPVSERIPKRARPFSSPHA